VVAWRFKMGVEMNNEYLLSRKLLGMMQNTTMQFRYVNLQFHAIKNICSNSEAS
jgi:hypothetical protein